MEELLANLKTACAGLSPEEIEAQVVASQHAGDIGDTSQLARFLAALSQADGAVTDEPEPDEPPDQAGND